MGEPIEPREGVAEALLRANQWPIDVHLRDAGVDPYILEVVAPTLGRQLAEVVVQEASAAYQGQGPGEHLTIGECVMIVAAEAVVSTFLRGISVGRELQDPVTVPVPDGLGPR